jgi:hypothetical protein
LFKGDDVVSVVVVSVPDDVDVMKSVVDLARGSLVKVKCRIGFHRRTSFLLMELQKVDEISRAKLVVD